MCILINDHVNDITGIEFSFSTNPYSWPGGEDCTVRIWSIKTGEQIFSHSVPDGLFTALCWPESGHGLNGFSSLFDLNHSWGAWMGSRDGLFYMHGT
jgi:WD repeat-containing protein 21A